MEIRLEKSGPAPVPPEVLETVKKADEAYKAGRFAEAQAEYEKLLALRPDLATTIHQQMGFSLIQQKKYPEALEHLQKVLDADPANAPIRVIAAQAALSGGLIDRGLALLKALDESAIKTPDVFFNVGVALINANRPEDAIPLLRQGHRPRSPRMPTATSGAGSPTSSSARRRRRRPTSRSSSSSRRRAPKRTWRGRRSRS